VETLGRLALLYVMSRTASNDEAALSTPQSNLRRRVHFSSRTSLYTDFTPYGEEYGISPRRFDFDSDGGMILRQPESQPRYGELIEYFFDVDLGDTIQCFSDVYYHLEPLRGAQDTQLLTVGNLVHVLERQDDWVRDEIGWLPLFGTGLGTKKRVHFARPAPELHCNR
jgi:hypothetical protein